MPGPCCSRGGWAWPSWRTWRALAAVEVSSERSRTLALSSGVGCGWMKAREQVPRVRRASVPTTCQRSAAIRASPSLDPEEPMRGPRCAGQGPTRRATDVDAQSFRESTASARGRATPGRLTRLAAVCRLVETLRRSHSWLRVQESAARLPRRSGSKSPGTTSPSRSSVRVDLSLER